MSKDIPFVSFSNEELEDCKEVSEGHLIVCPVCGQQHPLQCGFEPSLNRKSEYLMFYTCGKKSYLGALNNKLVVNLWPRREQANER